MKIEDYGKYYIQGSDHYLIPKDEFKELFNEMVDWKEESKKQKEVIDKAIELINRMDKECEEEGCSFVNLIEVIKIKDILKEVSK